MMRQNGVRTRQNGSLEIIEENGSMHKKPALTYLIEIIGRGSDGCSRYGLRTPLWAVIRQNGGRYV